MAKAVTRRAVLDGEGDGDEAGNLVPAARSGSTPSSKSGQSSKPSRRDTLPVA